MRRRLPRAASSRSSGANTPARCAGRADGEALLCVRYRLAEDGARRFTTVELLVDEAPTRRSRTDEPVGARIGIGEAALRAQVKAAGGRWDLARKL
jgi:hypothetical protein